MDYAIIEARLSGVRATLERELAAVPDDRWRRKPASGGWSVGEVIAHLIQVETAVHNAGTKRLADGPRPLKTGWLPRALWPPIWLIPYRWMKRQSPIPMDPVLVTAKPEMLAKFAERRKTTLGFLRTTIEDHLDLDGYHWKHPFFGELTFGEWCRVLAYHETRHTKQIREIVRSFQS